MKRHRQLLLLIAVAIYLLQLLQYRGYLLDDSFISLRYARNLVDGQGLVFNPGERVEGYTNFLFVLVAAVFLRIGIEPIAGLKWLGAAMALWVLWLLRTLERRMTSGENSERSPPFSVALLLPLPAFAYWSVCPMETMWFTALLLWALSLTLGERTPRRLNGAALVFVLLSLTRPEGAYLFAVWTGILLILDYRRGDRAILLVRYVQGVAIFAGLFGGDVVWRHQYYGSWLPNTFHAKVVGGEGQLLNGLSYLKDWLLAFPVLATVLLLPVGLVSRRTRVGRNVPQSVTALYLLTIAYIIYVVLIGGDFMPFFRFLLPIMPVCCLLLAWVWRDVVVPRAPGAIAVAIVVWVVHVVCSFVTEQPYRAFVAHRTAVVGKQVGEWFGQRLLPDDLIAINTAGSLPYYSNLPAVDMLGLTDAQIAHRPVFIVTPRWAGHRRGWGEYVLSRRPRIILWYNAAGGREPYYLGDHELADNPWFRFFYQLKTVRLPAADPGRVVARFLGFPFGFTPAGSAPMADLGVEARFQASPVPQTILYDASIALDYFEFDSRDTGLWEMRERSRDRIAAFVDAIADRWRADVPAAGDLEARAAVEARCAEAYEKIQMGDYQAAKQILATAAERNGAARSPLVYQYVANVAVLTGEPFVAVSAQKEALRLAPDNELYRRNLTSVLAASYKQARTPMKTLPGEP